MSKKWIAIPLIGIFIFILLTTAWDHWGPPKSATHFIVQAPSHSHHIMPAPPHCFSLHDVYDASAHSFNIVPSVNKNVLSRSSIVTGSLFTTRNLSNFYDRPPPLAPPVLAVPLFQLYHNLRI
jgi:hypothetical protein